MANHPNTVKCPNCAAAIDTSTAVGGVVKCRYCKQPVVLPKTTDGAAYVALETANNFLNLCDFDRAYETYRSISDKFPDEPEAYFGMALAANKVRYINDVKNNCLQPICYGTTNKTFVSDGNYIKSLSLATVEQRSEYTRKATEIDYIRNEFYKLKQSGKEYDCFICVKVSGENGHKTIDSERANDIYYHLKDKGYRPFYSEREIQNETGVDYEARILYALFASPCMLVVCSDESYLQTPWVKNEYSRFISLINDEQKEANSIAIGFFDTPIERLPGRNGSLQGVCLKNPDAYSKIVDFVNNCSPAIRQRKAQAEAELKRQLEEQAELQAKQLEEFRRQQAQAQKELQDKLAALQNNNTAQIQPISVGSNTSVQSLLMRVNQFLDGGDFNNAKLYCNRVLDIDPNNGEAWMGLLMASYGACSPRVFLKKVSEKQFVSSKQVLQVKSDIAFTNAKKYAIDYKDLLDEVEAVLYDAYSDKLNEEKLQAELSLQAQKEKERNKLADLCLRYCNITGGCLVKFFEECTLTDITIPSSVTSIGKGAFYDCRSLTCIEMPNSVTSIGDYAFEGCSSLMSITIPSSVTSIGKCAFSDCCGLTNVTVQSDNIKYHSDGNCLIETASKTLISGCKNSVIPIDGSVTSIGERAFDRCSSLTSIEIPNSVTSIGKSAFFGCSSLTSITIPSSVTSVGEWSFCSCDSLKNITVESDNTTYYSNESCLIETASKTLIALYGKSIIPNDGCVTSIGSGAVCNRSISMNIHIPNNVTSIENNAFCGCDGLMSITFAPNSKLTSIGELAFFGCSNLTSIEVPNSVTSIGEYAFEGCSNLTSIELSQRLMNIGNYALSRCSNLKHVTIPKRFKNELFRIFDHRIKSFAIDMQAIKKIKFTFTK